MLNNFEDSVKRSLPVDKVKKHYNDCPGAAKQITLNYVTVFEERKQVYIYKAFWNIYNLEIFVNAMEKNFMTEYMQLYCTLY